MSEIEKPCPKCGNEETYLRSDGKTMICWRCKHTWKLKKGTESNQLRVI